MADDGETPRAGTAPGLVVSGVDVAIAGAGSVLGVAVATTRVVAHGTGAVVGPLDPRRWVRAGVHRGREQRELLRERLGEAFEALLDEVLPRLVEEVVRRVDLTALVEEHVDLDRLVAGVDLEAAAERLDVDAVAGRIDLTALVDRLDLMRIVRDRIDLDALVGRVDLDAVVRRVDLDAVLARVDLVERAEEVISALDLPEIIRESTRAVSSESVQQVRMRGIAADDALTRTADRLRPRRRRNDAAGPAPRQAPG